MIRSGLIEAIHINSKLSKEQSELAVKVILEVTAKALAQGKRVEVRDFGSFNLRLKPERNAHNPKTGKKLLTSRKHGIHFKPGKGLKERVDASKNHVDIVDE